MIRFLRRNTVAFIALFIALGGTAYAANTVRSADIVDGTIQTQDIANGAVAPAKTTGAWTFHNVGRQLTSDCVTKATNWTACAPVKLTVPAGHRYAVTVQSNFEVAILVPTDYSLIHYCAAGPGPACFAGTYSELVVENSTTPTTSDAGHAVYGPGTYTFSTALWSSYALQRFEHIFTTTTVIATDAASTVH